MRINKIAIIGLGLIGGSLAKSLRHSIPELQIAAFDYPETIDTALYEKSIDTSLSNYNDALNSDIIFITLPINESLKVFKELVPDLKENQIISDFCSVKGIFADIWEKVSSKGLYIGAHPMTGKEKGGYQNSDNLLFENSVFIICYDENNVPRDNLDEYTNLIKSTGAKITFLDSKLHDKITARVSHLPQLLSVLLVNQAAKVEGNISFIDFAGGGFRDMTRIASSDFKIWKSVIDQNKKEIIQLLSLFNQNISELISFIENNEYDKINELFELARITRDEIPFNNKGFLDQLFDITVFVKDEPGMISKISTVLFQENINIKDIELLKIREGRGGNFKFYFESEKEAIKAKILLEKSGFKSS